MHTRYSRTLTPSRLSTLDPGSSRATATFRSFSRAFLGSFRQATISALFYSLLLYSYDSL